MSLLASLSEPVVVTPELLICSECMKSVPPIPVSAEPSPTNDVAVNAPLEELNVRLVPLFGARFPVASVVYKTLHDVSDDSSATVT